MTPRWMPTVVAAVVPLILLGGCASVTGDPVPASAATGRSPESSAPSRATTGDVIGFSRPSAPPRPSGSAGAPVSQPTRSAPAPSTEMPPTTHTPTEPADLAWDRAKSALDHSVRSDEDDVMAALPGGGFEAMIFDTTGHVRFLATGDGTVWHQERAGTYPYDPAIAMDRLSAEGMVLTGMQHATFILRGRFTPHGFGDAMAFTVGPQGWGPLVQPGRPDQRRGGLLEVAPTFPPASPSARVAYHDLTFTNGALTMIECDASYAGTDCGEPGSTVRIRWAWDPDRQVFRQDA